MRGKFIHMLYLWFWWFNQWIGLGDVSVQSKWQGIALISDDQDRQCHITSLDHNGFIIGVQTSVTHRIVID